MIWDFRSSGFRRAPELSPGELILNVDYALVMFLRQSVTALLWQHSGRRQPHPSIAQVPWVPQSTATGYRSVIP